MSWHILGAEKKLCPPEYQTHVNQIGGFNRFGEPNFRIVWGMSEMDVVYGTDGAGRTGRHVIYKHGGIPAWFIESWKPPECFGTPEMWYVMSWDPETLTHRLGEYPWRGLYMPVTFNLYVRRIIPGYPVYDSATKTSQIVGERMEYDAMPLNHYIIDLTVPNLLKEQDETFLQKKVALANRMAIEKAKAAAIAEGAYLDAAPAWGGKASSKESNREAWMQRIKEKQAGMHLSADQIRRTMGKGHRQH